MENSTAEGAMPEEEACAKLGWRLRGDADRGRRRNAGKEKLGERTSQNCLTKQGDKEQRGEGGESEKEREEEVRRLVHLAVLGCQASLKGAEHEDPPLCLLSHQRWKQRLLREAPLSAVELRLLVHPPAGAWGLACTPGLLYPPLCSARVA